MPKFKPLARRTFLRGLAAGSGVALALPPLEAMLTKKASADALGGPFFGVFFWANGLPWHAQHGGEQAGAGHPDIWTPSSTGAGYAPSQLLMPLAPHNVSVATGLEPKTQVPRSPGGQSDGHMRGFMVALTGDRPRSAGFDHSSHTLTARRPSIDQYVARHDAFYTEAPRFRSLQVGVSNARFHDYGHWNAISYNGPDSLNLPVMNSATLYDYLFSERPMDATQTRRTQLLDAVLEDARSLRTRLGVRDQRRVDAHLAHLSDIQRRLASDAAVCEPPARPGTDSGDLIRKTEMMADLLGTAINCGLTRVFSFMLTSPATTHVFNNVGVPDNLHKTCHDGHWDRVRRTQLYQMQAFAAFLDRFSMHTDAEGASLLDRGLIFGTSEYGEGWKHSVKELPALFAGNACGAFQQGVHARHDDGNFSMAHVTALRALGIPTPSFGFNGGETSNTLSGMLT